MTVARRRISAFILAILLLHVIPVARELTGGRETLWPFLTWGMYRHASGPPVATVRHRLYGIAAGRPLLVEPDDAGFDRFAFRRYYRIPIAAGDSIAARDLARRLEARWGDPVRAILVEETAFVLSDGDLARRTAWRRIDTDAR